MPIHAHNEATLALMRPAVSIIKTTVATFSARVVLLCVSAWWRDESPIDFLADTQLIRCLHSCIAPVLRGWAATQLLLLHNLIFNITPPLYRQHMCLKHPALQDAMQGVNNTAQTDY